jgi:serine/threonine-protein kinase
VSSSGNTATLRPRPLPAAVGAYAILAMLGEGGMGVVYKARQRSLNRLVALKMISAGPHAGTQARARFHTEGQAIARLRHPHVVQIYELGEHEGLPYYSMELLEGGSLAARLADGPMPPRAAAELVQTLAAAVQYAHQMQVLHRDLKPANILLTEAGQPKIADFGLAKLLDSEDGHTRSDMALGTPSYMAPEQAAGRSAEVGPAVDVYALGAVLYHALTGKPPFRGADRAETLRQVREQEPLLPSQERPEVTRELDAICLKCLAKDPAQRYVSALALADDVARWLRGEQTVARPPRYPSWLVRWLRISAIVLCLLAIFIVIAATVIYWRDPQRRLEPIEAALAAGQSVRLLGETGEPRWYRWRSASTRSQSALAEDGTFEISSWKSACRVELLPSMPQRDYRITAEVRHVSGDRLGSCGIYFMNNIYPVDKEEVQYGIVLRLDGVSRPKQGPFPGNPLILEGRLYCDGIDEVNLDSGFVLPRDAENLIQPWATFPWHILELTVSPASIRITLDEKPAGTVTTRQLEQELLFFHAHAGGRMSNYLRQLPPDAGPTPRGGLGLFVSRATATFRNVVVTPLAGEP